MTDSATSTERNLWLPPRRMARYQWAKVVGGLLFAVIFAGWMLIQWSSVAMRVATAGLLTLTAWVTAASIVNDLRRTRGRQVAIASGRLVITTPTGQCDIALTDVAEARWRDDPPTESGLSFHDAAGRCLARLDPAFLESQAEARAFLRWARERADLPFRVVWPEERS